MGRRGRGSRAGGGSDQEDPQPPDPGEDLTCKNCKKVFSTLGNLNHHEAKCSPTQRKSKRKVSQVYKQFKLNQSDELTELFARIPCNYLRYEIARATNTYVPDIYPGFFNVTSLSPRKSKLDKFCLILADAKSHQEVDQGIRIPRYFGKCKYLVYNLIS